MKRRDVLIGLGAAGTVGLATAARRTAAPTALPLPWTIGDRGYPLTRTARPLLVWRYPGEQPWRESRAQWVRGAMSGGVSRSLLAFGPCRAEVALRSVDAQSWRMDLTLSLTGQRAIELARVHYLDGTLEDDRLGMLVIQSMQDEQMVRPGHRLPSRATYLHDLFTGWHGVWPMLADPIYDAPDWSLSRDIGVLTSGWNNPGWTLGFTGPGAAFGEIGFHTGKERRFFAGALLDNILLKPGERRPLDTLMIWDGDWQRATRSWVSECARAFGPVQVKPPVVGYCSWYQQGSNVTAADVERANTEVAAWPKPPGGRLIQIDDGWEMHAGDWQPNAKFALVWAQLPAEIRKRGSIPGTYLVPTCASKESALNADHPDWIQRLPDGEPAILWPTTGGMYALEIDRPEVAEFMRRTVREAREAGWGYAKIDFSYLLSTRRQAYDRSLTSFQSLRRLFRLYREAAGPDMMINACIGEAGRYAIGYADVTRIGGDIGAKWSTVRGNLVATLLVAATNGSWWQADPDVFYMRQEKNALTADENEVLTGTLALFGGAFLTSDWPSQWSPAAQDFVRRFWTVDGPIVPADQRLLFEADGTLRAYRVSYASGALRQRVGLYNWADSARDMSVAIHELGLPDGDSVRLLAPDPARPITLEGQVLRVANQPPHSLRLAELG